MKPFNDLDSGLKSRKRKALEEKELLDKLKDETNFENAVGYGDLMIDKTQ